MWRTLRAWEGRTVVVPVDGEAARGELQAVTRHALVLAHVAVAGREAPLDGVLVVPLPVSYVQVV
ncbi:hypothetical protein CWT12_12295 [Actinomyces sp. 432]|uniref:hypothetical protein n=1 Tax=Actinomyces sp. 432 TaxID=2057798 RepID=UPI001373A785|nr:hypothetical protein [Actinomyces sp. 432]QHO91932.1 hypothetical protein CWT12_12295 [Actinomyces sp. 432]